MALAKALDSANTEMLMVLRILRSDKPREIARCGLRYRK
jgi:hypothetical protein